MSNADIFVPLGSLIHAHYGRALKQEDRNASGAFDVFGSGGVVGKHDEKLFEFPSIVIGRKGSVGALTFAPDGGWAIDTAYYVEIKNPEALELRFLFHALKAMNLAKDTITTSIPGLNRDTLLANGIVLPSRKEQEHIAAILDKADSVRRKRLQSIQLADDFLRAIFLDMFGDPVSNSKNWPEKKISEFSVITTGNTPSRDVEANFGSAIEWIKSDNINTPSHFLTPASEYLSEVGAEIGRTVTAGATLMTCIAGSPSCIGNVALADRKVAFNQQINAMTPSSGVEPEFLYCLMLFSKKRIQASSTNSMKGMISKGVMEQIKLIWPPKHLQEKFAKNFKVVLALRDRMNQFDVDSLCSSLQAEYLG